MKPTKKEVSAAYRYWNPNPAADQFRSPMKGDGKTPNEYRDEYWEKIKRSPELQKQIRKRIKIHREVQREINKNKVRF